MQGYINSDLSLTQNNVIICNSCSCTLQWIIFVLFPLGWDTRVWVLLSPNLGWYKQICSSTKSHHFLTMNNANISYPIVVQYCVIKNNESRVSFWYDTPILYIILFYCYYYIIIVLYHIIIILYIIYNYFKKAGSTAEVTGIYFFPDSLKWSNKCSCTIMRQ
jgi:hypothetical protein